MNLINKILSKLFLINNNDIINIQHRIDDTNKKALELKKMQRELYDLQKKIIEQQNKLISIIETASEAIIVIDSDYNVLVWNEAAYKLFKLNVAEISKIGIKNILPIKLIESIDDYSQRFKLDKDLFSLPKLNLNVFNYNFTDIDGNNLILDFSSSSWRNNGDIFFTIIVRDLTNTNNMLHELNLENCINTFIINNISDGIFIIDDKFKCLVWNNMMEKITGIKSYDILNKNILNVPQLQSNYDLLNIINSIFINKEKQTVKQNIIPSVNSDNIFYKFNLITIEKFNYIVVIACKCQHLN